MDSLKQAINRHYRNAEPATIVLQVLGTVAGALVVKYVVTNASELKEKTMSLVFGGLKSLPAVKQKVDEEKQKVRKIIGDKLALPQETVLVIPTKGLSKEEVLARMQSLRQIDEKNWKGGKVSGVIYSGDEQLTDLMNNAYSLFSLTNPLHPDIFPSIRKFEAEIIRMTASMMNGDENSCGVVTSGGTESILMAVRAYREKCKKSKPEMVIPVTAHAAFDKAANYFGIKLVHVRIGADCRVDVKALEAAINKNTIMIVGSAPQYAHGTVDPIPELAAIAQKHGIGMHVDSCLGGYVLPWVQKSGIDNGKIPIFDFRIPGVTSISVDTHKYGYATKGTSVLLFRDEDLRRNMFFVQPNWPGGMYASPTIAGSRPGGLIACCWAALVSTGQEGYIAKSTAIWQTAQKIKEGIKKISSLELVGDSYSTVIAFTSSKFDIYKLGDAMSARGWHLNNLQRPNCAHICCTHKHIGMEQVFLKDLVEATALVESNPNAFPDGLSPIYGMTASFPDRSVISEMGMAYLDGVLEAQKVAKKV